MCMIVHECASSVRERERENVCVCVCLCVRDESVCTIAENHAAKSQRITMQEAICWRNSDDWNKKWSSMRGHTSGKSRLACRAWEACDQQHTRQRAKVSPSCMKKQGFRYFHRKIEAFFCWSTARSRLPKAITSGPWVLKRGAESTLGGDSHVLTFVALMMNIKRSEDSEYIAWPRVLGPFPFTWSALRGIYQICCAQGSLRSKVIDSVQIFSWSGSKR